MLASALIYTGTEAYVSAGIEKPAMIGPNAGPAVAAEAHASNAYGSLNKEYFSHMLAIIPDTLCILQAVQYLLATRLPWLNMGTRRTLVRISKPGGQQNCLSEQ